MVDKINDLMKQAIVCGKQGRLPEAMEMFHQALALDPENFDALQGMGIVIGRMGNMVEALKYFTRACAVQPNNYLVHYYLGSALINLTRYQEALSCYDKAISIEPGFVPAHYDRGNTLLYLGRYEEALASYDRVIALKPDYAEAHSNRATVLIKLKRYAEALASCDQAIFLAPNYGETHTNRGNVLRELKRYEEALASYDQAIALNPGYAGTYLNRGTVLRDLNRNDEALASYDRVIALKPDYAEAHSNRATVLINLKRYAEALASYERVIALKPDYAEAWSNRGNVLRELNRYAEALASYDRALALKPDYAEAWSNRGTVLRGLLRYPEALASYDRAIALNPHYAGSYNNRGNVLQDLRRYEEALTSFDQVISLDPDNTQAHINKAFLALLRGDYATGWPLNEWRWQTEDLKYSARHFSQPQWRGDTAIAGQTLLLYPEQGLGDVIQMVRYVPLVEALGARVILEVPASLKALLRTLKGRFELVTTGDPLPDFDLHCPLMSLPLAFRTTVDTIPADVPYLAVDSQKQIAVCNRIGPKIRQRIGLVWSGRAQHRNDRNRSIALRTLVPLLSLDYEYHSLQKEVRLEDEVVLKDYPQLHTHHEELKDFADTAAWVAAMDLIITVDTSVAHLAGALGQTTWIVLPYSPDWRWLTERRDSPWYPTVRLFRQTQPGDWDTVIAHMQSQLIGLATSGKPR